MKRNNISGGLQKSSLGADYADYTECMDNIVGVCNNSCGEVLKQSFPDNPHRPNVPCNLRNPHLKSVCIIFCLLLCTFPLYAQDPIPSCPLADRVTTDSDTIYTYSQRTDTVTVPQIVLPATFKQPGLNELTDSIGILKPFWERLRLLRAGYSTDTVRIVHIGDSHVRGHIFPRTAGSLLTEAFGAVSYTDMGINGAFCFTFTKPDRISDIAALHPDLVILSFGTNESHNRRYNAIVHYRQMDELVRMLRDSLPDALLLMTTPPGSYESFRKSRRQRTYSVNPRTAIAVQTIRRFADDNGLALWDMYGAAGGSRQACLNWQQAGLMRPDHIHYLPEGYVLQGELFYQALIKAYNDYVEY
ncbi:SGNH/GDSL hydrolase family protein [Bacteroides sp. UBA939]|uniref:SGNH/GDSL hydrolase family protein n=1 Tax=Bacteroides sp. UBA939 TaxID=1946092 RepID=UPI0025C1FAF4|nr:SGNH/GDSL hydrolase family protein [Bacteroides sp. UBA939]